MTNSEHEAQACFVGGGKLAEAIMSFQQTSGIWEGKDVWIADPDPSATDRYAGCSVVSDASLLPTAPVVFLCAQPPDLAEACKLLEQGSALMEDPVVIIIAPGVSCATVNACLTEPVRLVRAMTNSAFYVEDGCTFGFATDRVSDSDRQMVEQHVSPTHGSFHWVGTEQMLNAATALAGAGPAYCYLVLEAMIAAGVEMGLQPDEALLAATHTMAGAAKTILDTQVAPATLRASEAAADGATGTALAELQERGFADALKAAIKAARGRAEELGNGG